MDVSGLPFKVGQMAESKSFLAGFRGAWFRGMIKDICYRRGKIGFSMQFVDYPDEKVRWTQLYQKIPGIKGARKRELMVRPVYPHLYRETEVPPEASTDVILVVNDMWKVGHLVDWWYQGCYWSGRITTLLGEGKILIELPKPPIGEGGSYEAFLKDLRPSLDWSSEFGWILPSFTEIEGCCAYARLLQPREKELIMSGVENPKETSDVLEHPMDLDHQVQSAHDNVYIGHQPASSSVLLCSLLTSSGLPHSNGTRKETSDDSGDAMKINIVSSSLLPPSSHAKPMTMGIFQRASENREREFERTSESRDHIKVEQFSGDFREIQHISERINDGQPDAQMSSPQGGAKDTDGISGDNSRSEQIYHEVPSKRMRVDKYDSPNSEVHVDPVESSIMELEELANKLTWLEGLLKFGLNWSMEPSWKFKSD